MSETSQQTQAEASQSTQPTEPRKTAQELRRERNARYRQRLAAEGVGIRGLMVHDNALADLEALAAATLDGETTVAEAAEVLLPIPKPNDKAAGIVFTPHSLLQAMLAEGSGVPKKAVEEMSRLNGCLALALAERNKFLERYELARQKQLAGLLVFHLKGQARREMLGLLGIPSTKSNAQVAAAMVAKLKGEGDA